MSLRPEIRVSATLLRRAAPAPVDPTEAMRAPHSCKFEAKTAVSAVHSELHDGQIQLSKVNNCFDIVHDNSFSVKD